jgi:hypothetical protein
VSGVSLGARWLAYGLDLLLPQTQTMINIGVRMAQVDAALVELDEATNEVARELDELANQIEAADANVAGEIRTRATRLRALAADPENPVPDEDAPTG